MQDQDAPPEEEGETDGGVAVVQEAGIPELVRAAINSTPTFTRPRWITAIVPPSRPETMARENLCAPGGLGRAGTPKAHSSPLPCARTRTRESLPSWTTFSFKRKFRRRRVSPM